MPSVVEAAAKPPAEAQTRLVVYVTSEHARWVEALQQEAQAQGRRVSASAIVRAALDVLRLQE